MTAPNAASGSRRAEVAYALVAPAVAAALFWAGAALAQNDSEALAEELANPLAELGSLPFLGNYNGDLGPGKDGSQWFVNIQPVVPMTLNADWHVISRTILPVMLNQTGLFPGEGSQSGLRDTTEGLYFSPSRTFNGFTWGAGPIVLLPTATDELLSDQIIDRITKELGIRVTPHQFRHFAAALILEKDPANYEFVRRVLGHKNLQTTINFYVGLETVEVGHGT
jgi:hypothetical protein